MGEKRVEREGERVPQEEEEKEGRSSAPDVLALS